MRTLRSRLTLTHAVVALVAVAVVASLASALIQRGFDRLADRQAGAQAGDLAERLADAYQRRHGWAGVEGLLRRRYPLLGPSDPARGRRVQLLDASGAVLFDSFRPRAGAGAARISPAAAEPVIVDGREVGTVLVSSARDELSQAERDFLLRMRVSVLIGSVAAVAVALLAGLLSAGRVTRPLRSLTAAAHRLAGGARHEPIPAPAERELAELATAFNSMASELERQEDLRRQLVADIAHELRTPLSVLRLQLESMEDGVEQPTPQLLGSLSEEVGLLSRLVDDLRLLSLADAGQLSLQIAPVDAGDAVRQAAASAAARARQRGVAVAAEPPAGPLAAAADQQRLAQALGNLTENALRYTPAGGAVTIGAELRPAAPGQPPAVVFTVRDTGPGIPPEDLARIFDRFWRADRARARETGGSGLGLAIVRRLAELQGGSVWATSQVGSGAAFHIALPLAGGQGESALAYARAGDAR